MTVLALHRRALLALTLLVTLALAPLPTAQASCPAPLLVAKHDASHSGADYWRFLTVSGKYFMDGCGDDVGTSSGLFGCGSHTDSTPPKPLKTVVLTVEQNGKRWTVGAEDADAQGNIAWSVTLPTDLQPGPATLRAAAGQLQIDVPRIKSGR